MDLAALATGIETWLGVTALDVDGGGTALPVEFGRLPKKVHTSPFVLVYLGPIGKLGWDISRYTYNSTTGANIEQMHGARRMPVRISFRAFNQGWGKSARQFAEDFRVRHRKPESLETLRDAGMALWDSTDLIDTDYEYSGRLISQCDMTVYIGVWAYERSAATDAGFLQTVNFEGQSYLLDQHGNPIKDGTGNWVVDLNIKEFSVDARIEP